MNTSRTLRSLDKERYLIKIGDKAISKLEEPFRDMIKEYNKFKRENMDNEGNVGDMDFEDNDLFGNLFISQAELSFYIPFVISRNYRILE